MIQKAQIKKKQQPNLKMDQHKLTKTTDEAIRMKSSKRSNQEPTTLNYRNRGKAEKDKKKKRRQYINKWKAWKEVRGWMWIISCMRCYFYYFILDFFLNI